VLARALKTRYRSGPLAHQFVKGTHMTGAAWRRISSKVAHKNPFFCVREDKVIQPNCRDGTFYVIETSPSVMIVPVSGYGEIYLIMQHRHPTGIFSWEIPGGALEGGSDLENAKRELRDETGLVSNVWTKLGEVQVMSGTANNKTTVFIAEKTRETSDSMQEEDGIMRMQKVSLQRVFEMIRAGELNHSETIMAITLAALYLKIM
jgi:8-oxo-dGTP pyrophosphatase MutT (NUDIX family)